MNIENLALGGGALKGIAYIGCFKAFEEYGIIKNLKKISGTSIGAVFGYGILLGFTSDQLREIMYNINYTFLRDIHIDNILSFSKHFGFDTGNNIEKIFKIITEKRGFSLNITFEQFYQITGIEFIVVGTCVSKREKVLYSYKTHPNFSVIKALRISSGFPLIFNKVSVDNEDYADGCLKENTPISCFTSEEDIEKTIAIELCAEITKYDGTLSNYIMNLFMCMMDTISDLQLKDYTDYVIRLDRIRMKSQISVSDEEKEEVIQYAYDKTIEYLEKRKLKYTKDTKETKDTKNTKIELTETVTSNVEDTVNDNANKKKEFSKLTEQINDILNYNI